MAKNSMLVVWFKDVGKEDVAIVGGKGANLGEMTRAEFPVPNGFIVTSYAYYQFIKENNLAIKIKHLIRTINFNNSDSLNQVSKHIKKEIMQGAISDELKKLIFDKYRTLGGPISDTLVAVRSSATAEDLPTASFAGQQETFLNVKGEANVIQKIKEAWASLFNARAIFYRQEKKFDHFKIGIAIPVQKMVASEKSGIMFTLDPVTNDKTKIVIEAVFGLGEYIVQGKTTPDHYEVNKSDLQITTKTVAHQTSSYVLSGTRNIDRKLGKKEGQRQKISDEQIKKLAEFGKKLEKHYYFPQDAEWAIEKNKIYIVQTRPVTTAGTAGKGKSEDIGNTKGKTIIVKGSPASPGIASGPVKIIKSVKEIGRIMSGDVMVAPQTNPDYVPAMKKAKAIITDSGGRTSHAAIVSRELGIPAVVGALNATKILKTGEIITVNGSLGEVYKGGFLTKNPAVPEQNETFIHTATKVYVNLAEPELAEKVARKQTDGIGLLRAEFMIAQIGIHPKKLIRDGKKQVFINKLVDGLETFCKAFDSRPVVYRTSDFKTNEYRNLVGGKDYELLESNPMLGYRGAFRYMHDPEVFDLELEAIKIVRNKKGYKNLWIMLPFVRTVKELVNVKKIISATGLYRSANFKIWMMVEIPANVILLEKFIYAGIDGISIGSNDLTMLILGTDRDNSDVAQEFDEQNDAVLWAFEHAIKTAQKHNITASICGQAPSLYPSLVEKLVSWGITSVSVAPDVIYTVRNNIYLAEKKLIKK